MKTTVILRHRFGAVLCTVVCGCFDPIAPVDDTGSGSSGTTDGSGSGPTPTSVTTGSTTNDPPDPTGEPTSTSEGPDPDTTMGPGTTEGPEPACGDGSADPGELCLPDAPATFVVGAGARYLAAGPLGPNVGVVTANPDSYTLSILVGDGIGGFAMPVSKSVGNAADGGPISVGLGDLEPDGDVDIVAHAPQETRWFLNNGLGQFPGNGTAVEGFGIFATPSLVVDNFDGNAALDVAWSDGYNICFLLGSVDFNGVYSMGDGSGCSESLQIFEDGFVAATEYGFDGDGFRDIVVAASWGPMLTAVRGNGNGTFMEMGAAANGVDVCAPASCDLNTIGAADLDADGEIELLAAHDQGVSIVPGNADGTFGMPYAVPADDAREVIPVDLDADGTMDLVVAARLEEALLVFLGNGDGTFAAPISFAVGAPVGDVAVEDFDEDGALDLVTAYGDAGSGNVALFLSDP